MFPNPVAQWNANQLRFCDWMQFYDTIYQADDRPDDSIIADNRLVDNWFENKVKEVERERKRMMAKRKSGGKMRSAYEHDNVVEF